MKRQAELAGLGIDPFVRTLIQGVDLRPRPPDEYAALLRELSAIGNNVNQIAHIANGRKDLFPDEVEETVWLIRQAWRLVKDSF
ncbi:MAG TPA: MobC family plasmid mobilization relaxosome protein [Pseudoflavonifractor sp.]|nr:MobC family plasmid mobilization relaxosome protein [Pseudoflavonifractor sp.]